MTNQELNRDVRRLKNYRAKNPNDMTRIANEFVRLYRADDQFEAMTKDNALFMLRLNLMHRFIPPHTFGIMIDL